MPVPRIRRTPRALRPSFALLCAVCGVALSAQSPFLQRYIADTTVRVQSIAATPDGGVVIAGVHTGPAPSAGLAVIKVDAAGVPQWSRLVTTTSIQDVPEVIALASGDLLLLSATFPARDLIVLRMNAAGDTLWTRAFDHPIPMMAKNAVELPSGDLVVASYTHQRFYLTRLTATGALAWSHGYVGGVLPAATLSDQRADVHLTADGNLIACGAVLTNGPLESNDFILKTDLNGTLLWGAFIGGDDEDNFRSVVETADSGFVAIGYHSPVANAQRTMIAVRFDKTGAVVWSRLYPTIETTVCKAIVPADGGGYVIAGSVLNSINGPEGLLFKIDDQGDVLWSNAYAPDMLFNDAVRVNAGLALAVERNSGTLASSTAAIMVQDTLGASGCSVTPYPLAPVDSTLLVSTAISTTAGVTTLQVTLAVAALPLTSVVECASTGTPVPADPAGVELHPNPADAYLVVRAVSGAPLVRVEVLDASGRTVMSQRPDGSGGVDVSALVAGWYAVRVHARDGRCTVRPLMVE